MAGSEVTNWSLHDCVDVDGDFAAWEHTIEDCRNTCRWLLYIPSYIIINPGTRSFESNNPGGLFVLLSRAKSAGSQNTDPDFCWHPSVLINEDRICHVVNTTTTRARTDEIARIEHMSKQTENKCSTLQSNVQLQQFLEEINH